MTHRHHRSSAVLALVLLLFLAPVRPHGGASASAGPACAVGPLCGRPAPSPAPPLTTTTTAPPVTTTTTTPPVTTTTTAPPRDPTGALLALLNHERTSRGLPPLARRANVDDVAAGWSVHLADVGALSHNDDYFSPATRKRLGGRALGENVARNASVEAAHRSLMNSPHHRANILDARFTVVGLGAVAGDGSWWVTEDFLQPRNGSPSAASSNHASSTTPRAATNASNRRARALSVSVPASVPASVSASVPTTVTPATTASSATPHAAQRTQSSPRHMAMGDVSSARGAAVAAAMTGMTGAGVGCARVRRRRSSLTAAMTAKALTK